MKPEASKPVPRQPPRVTPSSTQTPTANARPDATTGLQRSGQLTALVVVTRLVHGDADRRRHQQQTEHEHHRLQAGDEGGIAEAGEPCHEQQEADDEHASQATASMGSMRRTG